MALKLEGFWVPRDSWPRARELAMMYTWRHHNIMKRVKSALEMEVHNPATYKQMFFPDLAEEYHADPDLVTAQLFLWPGPNFFMIWHDYGAGYSTEDMIKELMLPWKPAEYYSITNHSRNISKAAAILLADKVRGDVKNRAYFLSPILKYDDPVNAHGFNEWPPCMRDFMDMELFLHDGVEAPIPVYIEYAEERG